MMCAERWLGKLNQFEMAGVDHLIADANNVRRKDPEKVAQEEEPEKEDPDVFLHTIENCMP